MDEILRSYLGALHGVVMASALVAAIVLRQRMRRRHLGWLVAAVAFAIVAFFGLLLATFHAGGLLAGLVHAVLLPALAAVATGCGALAGFTLMLAMFGLSLRDGD